jgi:hypothetical protein
MWILGAAYGDRRTEEQSQLRRSELEQFQVANVQELAVGLALPDFSVQSEGGVATPIRKALPAGGLIVYVSVGCESCFDAAEGLGRALLRPDLAGSPAILLVRGDASGLREFCQEWRASLLIFEDAEDVMAGRFHIWALPSHLVIDREGVVTEIGAGVKDEEEYARILAQGRTRPGLQPLNVKGGETR